MADLYFLALKDSRITDRIIPIIDKDKSISFVFADKPANKNELVSTLPDSL